MVIFVQKVLKMLSKISFCGLSHLGLVYSSVYSKYAKKVVCFDFNKDLIKNLKKNEININEPGLEKNISANSKKFKFTSDFEDLEKSKLIFISKDVATDANGNSDYSELNKLCNLIKKLKSKNTTIIILSQLNPGFTKKFNSKIKNQVYYQVETLIFGEAIKRALKPERFIIGSENGEIKSKDYYYLLKKFRSPILNMNYQSAEFTKIAINLFLISSTMTTNLLCRLSEKIDFNWDAISTSLKLDRRIGKYAYINPGLGLSGGNLERDLVATEKLLKKNKINISLVQSWKEISSERKNWTSNVINKLSKKFKLKSICMLGLSYKINTDSIKNSPAMITIKKNKNIFFSCNDPKVKSEKIKKFQNARFFELNECVNKSKIILIATPWPEYFNFFSKNKNILKNKILIDPFNCLKQLKKIPASKIYVLGKKC